MNVNGRSLLTGVLYAASAFGMAYTFFSIARLRAFAKRADQPLPHFAPSITVLKPLHGSEPQLYENLRTFCEQEYEQFDIVFGTAAQDDPALDTVGRLQRDFPHVRMSVISGRPGDALNPKVANLMGMEPSITGDIVVVADSDIRVRAGYLKALGALFADRETGAVTCIFSGLPNETLASRVGSMAVTDEFSPSVLVAASLAPVDFCIGATVALRRNILEDFGGFAAIADCLADDYEIGQRVFHAGHRILIAPFAVATSIPERRLRDIWHHEIRWARTVFRARPAGYAGTIVLQYGVLSAAAMIAAKFSPLSVGLFLTAIAVRTFSHFEAQRILAPGRRPFPHLLPVRIVLSFGVWCAAFTGRRVGWRGGNYEVNAKGRLVERPGDV